MSYEQHTNAVWTGHYLGRHRFVPGLVIFEFLAHSSKVQDEMCSLGNVSGQIEIVEQNTAYRIGIEYKRPTENKKISIWTFTK